MVLKSSFPKGVRSNFEWNEKNAFENFRFVHEPMGILNFDRVFKALGISIHLHHCTFLLLLLVPRAPDVHNFVFMKNGPNPFLETGALHFLIGLCIYLLPIMKKKSVYKYNNTIKT